MDWRRRPVLDVGPPCGDSSGLLARVSPLLDKHGNHRGSAHLLGNAIAKQGKWILLAEAAEAGIILSSYPATPQLSQCPEIGRLPGIAIAGNNSYQNGSLALVKSIQAEIEI